MYLVMTVSTGKADSRSVKAWRNCSFVFDSLSVSSFLQTHAIELYWKL